MSMIKQNSQENLRVITCEQLQKMPPSLLHWKMGSKSAKATQPKPPEQFHAGQLAFVSTPELFASAVHARCSIIVATQKALPEIFNENEIAVYQCVSISAAQALILPFFETKLQRFPEGIHPTAVISASATVGKNVRIGAFCTLAENCIIEDGAILGHHVVVEKNARVGASTILHPFVFVGAECQIAASCEIHPHVTIGSDGFGFVAGPDGTKHKVPQIGNVVIEDHVEIGANCAIDRATLGTTYIRRGTKLDNLCHIPHNSDVGQDGLLTAGFMMAGSTKIGRNFSCGGSTRLGGHLEIADDVQIGAMSVVTQSIPEKGAYAGHPAIPLKDYLRNQAAGLQLAEIRKQVQKIVKHLGLKD